MTPTQVRKARQRLGWTQQEMADALGVSLRTIKHWEAGTRNMSKPVLKLLELNLLKSETIPTMRSL